MHNHQKHPVLFFFLLKNHISWSSYWSCVIYVTMISPQWEKALTSAQGKVVKLGHRGKSWESSISPKTLRKTKICGKRDLVEERCKKHGLFLCRCECQQVTLFIVPSICVQQLLQLDTVTLQSPVLHRRSVCTDPKLNCICCSRHFKRAQRR